ncbi:MAG TPA: cyclic nucleotide-binding domain-containing protein [Acidimicrobiales bacterium]|nr:cyclic nucleotide-binding domain-containing protein [Acidimicrobiales bacterium]
MAPDKATVERLGAIDLFRRCSKKDLEALAAIVEEVDVPAGTVLCDQGRVADACYVIVEGEADVAVGGSVVSSAGPGRPIGEMGLVDHLPRSATVTARTPMHLYKISADRFEDVLRTSTVARGLLEHLSRLVRDLQAGRGSVDI